MATDIFHTAGVARKFRICCSNRRVRRTVTQAGKQGFRKIPHASAIQVPAPRAAANGREEVCDRLLAGICFFFFLRRLPGNCTALRRVRTGAAPTLAWLCAWRVRASASPLCTYGHFCSYTSNGHYILEKSLHHLGLVPQIFWDTNFCCVLLRGARTGAEQVM